MTDKIRAAIMAVVFSALPLFSLFGLPIDNTAQDQIQLFIGNLMILVMYFWKSGQGADEPSRKATERMALLQAENEILRRQSQRDPPPSVINS